MSIALSPSSIRYGAVALAATAALALAGCGSSSSSSHSAPASATTAAAISPAATPTTASLRSTSTATSSSATTSPSTDATGGDKGFAATTPAGFRNATASAQGGPINILYLATGPRVHGLTTNINVVREPSAGMTDMNAIVRAELKGLRAMLPGTLRISTPEPLTVAGEPARTVDYQYGPTSRRLHLRQVIVEHQGWIYVITYTASSTGYAASLPALTQMISEWRWV